MDDHLAEFGKYRIISELGRGGMGVVYLAEDGLLNRKVALKVLYEHLNRESAFVSRFQEEARSVSSLHHRNIVCVHGMERARDAFAIDMEYVEGLSLDRFAATTRISPSLAARLGSDILEGLVTCHDIGIVHRDIKPSNILIGHDSVAKITDFGLATAYAIHVKTTITGASSNGYFMGTPRYASPAAWDGQTPIPAWDLYSLGVILFELLSGQTAFAGESPLAIMKQHLTTALPPVGQVAPIVSSELASVVDNLLHSKGDTTSLTSLDVLKALQETPEFDAAKRADSTSTVTLAVRRHKIRRRAVALRPWVIRAVSTSALIAVAGVAVWLAAPRGDDSPSKPEGGVGSQHIDAPQVFLRPQSIDGAAQDGTVWMLSNDEKGKPHRIVAINALGLWNIVLVLAPEGNRYLVAGNWAEYVTPAEDSVRYGTFTGSALIDQEAARLTLSIARQNDRDSSVEQLNLIAKPTEEPYDQSKFILTAESNEVVQSLLYNELLNRDLPWAREMEGIMPSFPNGRITVPLAGTDIAIDGVLDEPLWTEPIFDKLGRVGELVQRHSGDTRLLLRWSTNEVVIAIDAEKVPVGARLEIGLMPGVEVSLNTSRRFFASLGDEGITEYRSTAGERELPWTCDWKVGVSTGEGRFQAEISIPTGQLSELAAPQHGRRWRLNAALLPAEGGTPLAVWGFEDGDATEHGALLVFSGDVQ